MRQLLFPGITVAAGPFVVGAAFGRNGNIHFAGGGNRGIGDGKVADRRLYIVEGLGKKCISTSFRRGGHLYGYAGGRQVGRDVHLQRKIGAGRGRCHTADGGVRTHGHGGFGTGFIISPLTAARDGQGQYRPCDQAKQCDFFHAVWDVVDLVIKASIKLPYGKAQF